MYILLKLHYAKFDVSSLFCSKVIEEKPWGSTPSGKGRVKSAQSCVKNNGVSTGYFALERGTRQGDPLFVCLFILAIEVLLIHVRDSELVRGIPVTDKEIKLDAYVDDGRFFLKDLQSLYTILDITEGFETFSSLKLNLQKSEAYWRLLPLGSIQTRLQTAYG